MKDITQRLDETADEQALIHTMSYLDLEALMRDAAKEIRALRENIDYRKQQLAGIHQVLGKEFC